MLDRIHQVPPNKVYEIAWEGDPLYYDLQLYQLGEGHKEFWVLNPEFENTNIHYFVDRIPTTKKCVVFSSNGKWVVKLFKDGWYPYHGYETVELTIPKLVWTRNPDIDSRMTFDIDPRIEYKLDFWDKDYELYWTMDSRFFPHEGEVWVYKASVLGAESKGTKFMDSLIPNVTLRYNEELDFLKLNYDELLPAYYELNDECIFVLDPDITGKETIEVVSIKPSYKKVLGKRIVGTVSLDLKVEVNPKLKDFEFDMSDQHLYYKDLKKEHIWMLDKSYLGPDDDEMWAVKIKAVNKTKGKIVVGTVEPVFHIETNPNLPELDFTIDYKIPWFDLKYEHLWMLAREHAISAPEPIWAIKVSAVKYPDGTKVIGDISPNGELEINGKVTVPFDLPKDFVVQYHDFGYEHVWISEEDGEKIWVAKLRYVEEPEGIKEYEMTDSLNPEQLDVVFISFHEPNAEKNWERVKEKAPWAQRVDGVTGILAAHQAAARKAKTDMFFVVDGDAYLVDEWNFSYQPSIFNRDCTYIWAANNPLTNLTYGHGGVKLFSKEKLLKLRKWRTLDMTTSVSEKIKVISEISNVTAFNTDSFSVWKTAFRECIKLLVNIQKHPANENHKIRFHAWKTIPDHHKFSNYAKEAAIQAEDYFNKNYENLELLMKINDRNWLTKQFNTYYKEDIDE